MCCQFLFEFTPPFEGLSEIMFCGGFGDFFFQVNSVELKDVASNLISCLLALFDEPDSDVGIKQNEF